MPLDKANELKIRKALADVVGTVPEAGYVIPSARYTSGIEEYWAAADPTKATRDSIETSMVAAAWLYPIQVTDDFASGCADRPLVRLTYEVYLFRQYGLLREDESATPDVFDKKVLVQHNEFVAAWLGIKDGFQRRAQIDADLSADFVRYDTQPVVQIEPIANQAVCEFVPGLIGYAVRLQETVLLLEVG